MEIEQPRKVVRLNSEDMSIKVKIGERIFQLTNSHYKQMPYFQESIVLSEMVYEEKYIPEDQFEIIMDIIFRFMAEDANVPSPPKIKDDNRKDALGKQMTQILDQLTGRQFNKTAIGKLNKLYHYSHYAKLDNLCHCIAAYLATKIYFKDGSELLQLKREHNITRELTFPELSKMKEQFSFMHLTD